MPKQAHSTIFLMLLLFHFVKPQIIQYCLLQTNLLGWSPVFRPLSVFITIRSGALNVKFKINEDLIKKDLINI